MMYLHEGTKLHRQEILREVETNRVGKAAAREGRANASQASTLAWELKRRSAGRFLKLPRALKGTLPGNGGGSSEEDRFANRHDSCPGGQRRQFSVAAALVNDPDVIFLDEPTTGLDPQMRHNLWELVRHLNQDEGKTVVITTHYMEEAELLADRVAIIDHGRIQAVTTR